METKFTPGPWHVDGGRIRNAASTLIATSAYLRHLRSQETEAANARLIAAAPTMLAALNDLFNEHGELDYDIAAIKAARAAIAAATGSQP